MGEFEQLFDNESNTIEAKKLKKLIELQDERLQIVDLRDREDYDKGHIPGAIPLPMGVSEDEWRLFAGKLLKKDKYTTVACYFGSRSEDAYDMLKSMGFSEIRILYDGMFSWNYKLEK